MRTLLHQFDLRLTHTIQQFPSWVEPIMTTASFVGKPIFTMAICMVVGVLGLVWNNLKLFYAGCVSVGTIGLGVMLKLLLQRDRPFTDYVLNMRLDTPSFPSGHAVGSTVAYGLAAYLLLQLLPAPWNYVAAGILIVLIVIIGISRVYLGAHFPSDVVAGWLLGLAGLAVIILLVKPRIMV